MNDDNPWGLTRAEVRVMDAVIEHKCYKLASLALGRSERTIEHYSHKAGQKMGARTMLDKFLTWDRWRRADPKAVSHRLLDMAVAGVDVNTRRIVWALKQTGDA